ncbi:hypothetical protein [Aquipuribacter hungaricus]|uniref:Asp23/Gls24 family envelope stress response protein n=1 Tax=Aquipuribacter hungaricus TaxID=545624 RepID=A0ABV7WJL3_9MICO
MSTSPAAGGLAQQADLVRTTALAVPGVADLHGGALGEVAVYLPGRRVTGVRLRDDRTEVHLVVTMGAPVRPTAEAVRDAVALVRPGRVDVVVEDVRDTSREPTPEPVAGPAPGE